MFFIVLYFHHCYILLIHYINKGNSNTCPNTFYKHLLPNTSPNTFTTNQTPNVDTSQSAAARKQAQGRTGVRIGVRRIGVRKRCSDM